jgi:hypothetical protein
MAKKKTLPPCKCCHAQYGKGDESEYYFNDNILACRRHVGVEEWNAEFNPSTDGAEDEKTEPDKGNTE